MRRIRHLSAAVAAALVLATGCYRLTVEVADPDNPEAVFMSPAKSGGVATHFSVDVVHVTSLFGLVDLYCPRTSEVLSSKYFAGKVENLSVNQQQTFLDGLVTMLAGGGLLVGLYHVRYEGDVLQ